METQEIKWPNVIGFALFILAVWILLHNHEEVTLFLSALGEIGPEHPTDRRIYGMIVFSTVGVLGLGVLKVLLQSKR